MSEITNEVAAGAPLPELNQVLIQQRIDYLHQHTDFALTLFRELSAYAIVALDFDGNVMAFNEGARRAFGYTPQEVIGRAPIDAFFPPEFIEAGRLQQAVAAVLGERQFAYDGDMLRNGGQRFPVHAILTLTKDRDGQIVGFILLAEDITERKLAQEKIEQLNADLEQRVLERTAQLEAANRALTESERRFRTVIETALDGILVVDVERHHAIMWNIAICDMLGYSMEEMSTLDVDDIHPPEALPEVLRQFERQRKGEIKVALDLPVRRKDGSVFFADITASPMTLAGRNYQVGIFHDVTERRRAEVALRKANRALLALSNCSEMLIHAEQEDLLLQDSCRVIVEAGGYAMAWIGYAEQDADKTVRPMASAGATARKFLDGAAFTWADNARGQCPAGAALRSGQAVMVPDIHADPGCEAWGERVRHNGFASVLALPLRTDGRAFGVLVIFAAERNAFDEAEIRLLMELAGNVVYGIATLRTRAERDQAVQGERAQAATLRQTLEQTIGAIALTLEKRDPYAAGHQQHVARLATAIATEMTLPPQQVEGIHFGALLHNIGMVAVPAEIVSRPSKLSDLQYAMIKVHPEMGFEIVKDIPFPWPVAQMVLQHHERLDGSGYPQGLAGAQIILEARILAVADVLEAMIAYRPYRAALGMDAARDALSRGRGIQFDPAVVDACLRVVKQPAYASAG